jgi:hypothetical protein
MDTPASNAADRGLRRFLKSLILACTKKGISVELRHKGRRIGVRDIDGLTNEELETLEVRGLKQQQR